MFEESSEGFVSRWRQYAAPVSIFSRVEGSPLVECEVAGAIIQTMERTGPYLSVPGPAHAVINPTVRTVESSDQEARSLEATGVGSLRGSGQVISRDDPFLVVDVGAPLVLGVTEAIPEQLGPGAWVRFAADAPVHFFLVREERAPVSASSDHDAV